MIINSSTRIVGLLGYPISHSYSPIMQNEAFEKADVNGLYIALEVKPEFLGEVVKGLSKTGFLGFNVTVPHKVEIMKYLDEIDENAQLIGAVNTVKNIDGKLVGYNTDGRGFLSSFINKTKGGIEDKKVMILGSGGASRAVSITLAGNGASKIIICNRTIEKAKTLTEEINRIFPGIALAISQQDDEIRDVIQEVDVIINTTSVGMHPNIEVTPLNKKFFRKGLTVCDVVYNPLKTRFLIEANDAGCSTVEGLSMLVHQGAEAFEIWTGKKASLDNMYNILQEYLAKA